MKFERAKTDKSKKRLKRVFYFTLSVWLFSGGLRLFVDVDAAPLTTVFYVVSLISFLVLLAVYVVHIFIEGLEKPTFISTETQNKFRNENSSDANPYHTKR